MRWFVTNQIARHERKMLLSGWVFPASAVIFLSMFFVSLFGGWRDYRTITQENRETERNERLRWLNQGVKGPHIAADQGLVVFLRRSPVSVFDPGILQYIGSSTRLGGHREEILTNKAAEGTHSLHRLGSLSAASVLQVFLPLVLILLLYRTIAGEREKGTLSQILASGVSPAELALGKLAGISAALSVIIVPVLVVGAITLQDSFAYFVGLAVVHAVYLAIALLLILAVSSRSSTSRQALAVLLCGWALAFVAAPVVITDIAQVIHPSPASLEYAVAQMDTAKQMPTVEERRAVVRARLLEQYGVSDLRELPVDPIGIELIEEEAESVILYGGLVREVYDAYEQQNLMYRLGAAVTPLLAVQPLSMAIAGTDFSAYRDFTNTGRHYREGMVKTLNEAIAYNPEYHNGKVFPGTDIIVTEFGSELWSRIPEFTYEAPRLAVVLTHSWTSLSLLFAWAVLAVFFFWLSLKRLSPV